MPMRRGGHTCHWTCFWTFDLMQEALIHKSESRKYDIVFTILTSSWWWIYREDFKILGLLSFKRLFKINKKMMLLLYVVQYHCQFLCLVFMYSRYEETTSNIQYMMLGMVNVYCLLLRNNGLLSHKQPKPVPKADFTVQSDMSSYSQLTYWCSQTETEAVNISSFFLALIHIISDHWELTYHKMFTVSTGNCDLLISFYNK